MSPWRTAKAALALALCCAAPSALAAATKAHSSANGLYAIRFVQDAPGKCRVEVQKDQDVVWTMPQCLGTVDDLFFVSNSGERFWQIRPLPEIPPRVKGDKKSPLMRAVVAVLYEKDGRVLRSLRLEDFIVGYRLGLVRQLGHHFKWLEGTFDVPGKGPRVTDKDEVELDTVAQKTHTLKFE